MTNSKSLAGRYTQLEATRHSFLERARKASELTIPTLVPPAGAGNHTTYPTPYQAIGARGVNNLASKLMMALLPPNEPFFRLTIDDIDIDGFAETDAARGEVEHALAAIERNMMSEVETSAVRVPVFEALKHLVVSGNVLMYLPKKGGVRVFRLDRYVIQRDPMGEILEIITKETVDPVTLDEKTLAAIANSGQEITSNNVDLYTCVKRIGNKYVVWQEISDTEIPDSRGTYPQDKLPYLPLRLIRVDGESYGRGFVEEYYGDLKSLEELTKAIVEGSAASAKVLFLVRPNGTTKPRAIAESPNGAIISGDANDVSVLQVQKHADLRVAQETVASITERLAYAFLLNSAVQRNAERVTAEEIRYMAQELETAMGGVYSILSQEFQLPLVQILLNRMMAEGKLPKLPKDTLKPQIITGVEALGRGQDLNKLAIFLQYLQPLGAEVIQQELNLSDYMDRLAASLGIDTNGLVKTPEQRQAEQAQQQQAQMQQMMQGMAERAAPQIAQGVMEQQQNG